MNSNVLIDCISILLVFGVVLSERSRSRDFGGRMFRMLSVLTISVLLFDGVAWLHDGLFFSGVRVLLYGVNLIFWLLQIFLCWLWVIFIDYINNKDRLKISKRRFVYILPLLIELVVLFSNGTTKWVFYLNEENIYCKGSYYYYNLLPYFMYIAMSLFFTINRLCRLSHEQKRRGLSLVVFLLLPLFGVIFGVFTGSSFIWPFSALSLLMVYLYDRQNSSAEEILTQVRTETELTRLRSAVLLNQLQPHFLYNFLNTIYELCETDKEKAKEATHAFSIYLRGKQLALSTSGILPFETELLQIENYRKLVMFRFSDRLQLLLDIKTKDFDLPPLTVLPIIEDEVKAGALQQSELVTITLLVEDKQDYILISVKSDFDIPEMSLTEDKIPAGLMNIRDRLHKLCHASMSGNTFTETEGKEIFIRLPKRQEGRLLQ